MKWIETDRNATASSYQALQVNSNSILFKQIRSIKLSSSPVLSFWRVFHTLLHFHIPSLGIWSQIGPSCHQYSSLAFRLPSLLVRCPPALTFPPLLSSPNISRSQGGQGSPLSADKSCDAQKQSGGLRPSCLCLASCKWGRGMALPKHFAKCVSA